MRVILSEIANRLYSKRAPHSLSHSHKLDRIARISHAALAIISSANLLQAIAKGQIITEHSVTRAQTHTYNTKPVIEFQSELLPWSGKRKKKKKKRSPTLVQAVRDDERRELVLRSMSTNCTLILLTQSTLYALPYHTQDIINNNYSRASFGLAHIHTVIRSSSAVVSAVHEAEANAPAKGSK